MGSGGTKSRSTTWPLTAQVMLEDGGAAGSTKSLMAAAVVRMPTTSRAEAVPRPETQPRVEPAPRVETVARAPAPAPSPPAPAPPTPSGTGPPTPPAPGALAEGWSVQLGAYASQGSAISLRDSLARSWPDARVTPAEVSGRTLWRVRVGNYTSRRDADEAAKRLTASGYRAMVVESGRP